jgi:hypothetical protein
MVTEGRERGGGGLGAVAFPREWVEANVEALVSNFSIGVAVPARARASPMRAPALLAPWLLATAACAAAYRAPFPRPSAPRASSVRLCEEPPPKPEEPPPLDAADVSGLYASLRKRQQLLGGRRDAAVKERALLAELAGPMHEEAIANIWEHWFGEEGKEQNGYLKTAGG